MSRTLSPLFAVTIAVTLGASAADAQFSEEVDRGSYSVAASERGFVLLDSQTGRTWILEASAEPEKGPVWIPLARINSDEEGRDWRQEKQAIVKAQQRHEHAERENRERREVAEREAVRRRMFQQRLRDRGRDETDREDDDRDRAEDVRDRRLKEFEQRRAELRQRTEERRRQAQRELLMRMEENRDQLREQHGDDHPSVEARNELIERLRSELEEGEEPSTGNDQADVEPDRAEDIRERQRHELEQRRSEFHRQAEEHRRQHQQKHLEFLEQQRDRLQDQFSEDHPSVTALSKQIEQLKAELEDQSDSDVDEHGHEGDHGHHDHGEHDHGDHDHGHDGGEHDESPAAETDQTLSELKPLLLKEQQLLRTVGPQHPEVREVSMQIELLRSMQSDDDVRRVLAERDEILKQHAQKQVRARKTALRKRILEKQAAGHTQNWLLVSLKDLNAKLQQLREQKAPEDQIQRIEKLVDVVNEKLKAVRREEHGADDQKDSHQQESPHNDSTHHGMGSRMHTGQHAHEHTVSQRLEAIENKLTALASKVDTIESLIRTTGQSARRQSPGATDASSRMTEELLPLLLEEQLLLEKLSPAHSKVKAVRKKIEIKRAMLKELAGQLHKSSDEPPTQADDQNDGESDTPEQTEDQ